GWSVCMHPEPAMGATAAGMVAELPRDARTPCIAWCSLTTPCTSLFLPLPVPLGVALPAPLATGTGEADPASAWWRLQALPDAVLAAAAGRAPGVHAVWAAREREWLDCIGQDRDAAGHDLEDRVREMLDRQQDLLRQLTSGAG